jgi:hypothetical protein
MSALESGGQKLIREKAWFGMKNYDPEEDYAVSFEEISDNELKFREHDIFGETVLETNLKYEELWPKINFQMQAKEAIERNISGWFAFDYAPSNALTVYMPWNLVENDERFQTFLRVVAGYLLVKKAKVVMSEDKELKPEKHENGLSGQEEGKIELRIIEKGRLPVGG